MLLGVTRHKRGVRACTCVRSCVCTCVCACLCVPVCVSVLVLMYICVSVFCCAPRLKHLIRPTNTGEDSVSTCFPHHHSQAFVCMP